MANEVITNFRINGIETAIKQLEDFKSKAASIPAITPQTKCKAVKDAVDQLEKLFQKTTITERSAYNLAAAFDKIAKNNAFGGKMQSSAEQFKNQTLQILQRLQQIDLQLLKKPSGDVLQKLNAEAKDLINQLNLGQKTLINLKSIGLQNSSPISNQVTNLLGSFGRVGGIASSIVSGAAVGGGAGAAIAAIQEAINLTKELASAVVSLGKDAVNAAADFEQTQRGLSVFTGGLSNAKTELLALDKVALNVPGLKLEDAEAGYQRLRALGFQAQVSTDLIKGLAVQTQLVGATSQDVNRVITNLIQLSVGSQRASQDVREIIHSIPSLRGVFEQAFGTADGKELGKIFSDNPNEAITKFSESLGKAQAATPGLNAALITLENTFTIVKRSLGEPLLEPFADSVKRLADTIAQNKDNFKDFGEFLANYVRGFNALSEKTSQPQIEALLIQAGLPGALFGLAKAGGSSTTNAIIAQLGLPGAILGVLNQYGANQPKGLGIGLGLEDDRKRIEQEQADISDKSLRELDRRHKLEQQQNDSNFKVQEARLTSHLNLNKQQELTSIKQLGAFRESNLQSQLQATRKYYEQIFNDTKITDDQKRKEIQNYGNEVIKINNEIALNSIETQKASAEKEKEIIEERKKAQKQIIDSQTNLFQLRTGGNPYVSIFDEARKALDNFTESFKDATPQQVAEFKKIQAEITRTKVEIQDFQNKIASQKYRNQAFDLRGLQPTDINGFGRRISGLNDVLGYSAETYNYNLLANQSYQLAANPFRTQDKALTELNNYQNQWTKFDDLAKNFGNLGIYGQAAIASAKMNLLPDGQSLLELSQQGNRQAQYALYQQGNLQSILAQASDQKLSDTLSKNSFLDQRTKYYSDQLKEAQAAVNRGSRVPLGDRLDNLLNVYDALGTENLTPQQLQEKFNALEAKAAQIERQKQEANKFYETMNRITNLERGLKVDFGNQTPFQVEVQSQSPIQLTLPKR